MQFHDVLTTTIGFKNIKMWYDSSDMTPTVLIYFDLTIVTVVLLMTIVQQITNYFFVLVFAIIITTE